MSAVLDIAPLPPRFRVEAYNLAGNQVRSVRRDTLREVKTWATEALADGQLLEVVAYDAQPEPGQWWSAVRYRLSTRYPGQIEERELAPTKEF